MFGTQSISNRPTAKLVTAASGMSLVAISFLFKEAERGELLNTYVHVGTTTFAIWLSFYGTFRMPTLHKFWGSLCLISGLLFLAGGFVAPLLGWQLKRTFTGSEIIQMLGYCAGTLLAGYLLVIDRDVADYRRELSLRFPAKDRLDPKVDNLPDDPINPS